MAIPQEDSPPNKLPGFGLPLNFIPTGLEDYPMKKPFPSALNHEDMYGGYTTLPLTTLREFTMLRIMNQITDKPDWHVKVLNDTIADKWKSEALASGEEVTQRMADWIIAELRYKASLFPSTGLISVYTGDVVKSDTAVPPTLKDALQSAVRALEDVPAREVDWHPGSGETVRDLVHPSLFPLVYGRTRVLEKGVVGLNECVRRCGEGVVLPVPNEEEAQLGVQQRWGPQMAVVKPFSRKFQWLPCEVDISGEEAKITSYINNLHPIHHANLYTLISQIITRAIPLWEAALTPQLPGYRYSYRPRIEYTECRYKGEDEEVSGEGEASEDEVEEDSEDEDVHELSQDDGKQKESQDDDKKEGEDDEDGDYVPEKTEGDADQQLENEDNDEQDDDDDEEEEENDDEANRVLILPEPGVFEPPENRAPNGLYKREPLDLRKMCEMSRRGLQVIVKLANIELTPEKPEYAGGTWHVEGQLNEHICATALYYYSSSNITTSKLAFRQQTSTDSANDIMYEQDHHAWLPAIFGCENEGPAVQAIGSVDTPEGRLLAFPNVLQHQVQPFSLADKTKNGSRKILALFLVDPHIQVTSTTHVPPQQREWWRELVAGGKGRVGALPVELQDRVFEEVEEFPISLEEAKKMRLELMEERKVFVDEHGRAFEESTFSLCEH